jgi:hypothetical protein
LAPGAAPKLLTPAISTEAARAALFLATDLTPSTLLTTCTVVRLQARGRVRATGRV